MWFFFVYLAVYPLVFKIALSTNKLYRFVLYFYPSLKKMHNFFVYYFHDFTKCTWEKNGKTIWGCLFVYSNTWGHFRFCWSWSRGISEISINWVLFRHIAYTGTSVFIFPLLLKTTIKKGCSVWISFHVVVDVTFSRPMILLTTCIYWL